MSKCLVAVGVYKDHLQEDAEVEWAYLDALRLRLLDQKGVAGPKATISDVRHNFPYTFDAFEFELELSHDPSPTHKELEACIRELLAGAHAAAGARAARDNDPLWPLLNLLPQDLWFRIEFECDVDPESDEQSAESRRWARIAALTEIYRIMDSRQGDR